MILDSAPVGPCLVPECPHQGDYPAKTQSKKQVKDENRHLVQASANDSVV